jgi:AcrR family transcriptional regulator
MIDPPHTKRMRGTPPPSPADMTRAALTRAALRLFGKQGFEGTSTREIAAAAKANIGSIAYHFGGKEGLRLAVADHIAGTMQAIAGQAMGAVPAPGDAAATPEEAERQLLAALERMVAFMVARPEAGEIIQFMLREMAQPTAALDRIYEGVFAPTHERICRIWEQATGEPAQSERTRLTVFTMIGQVLYFRIGREVVVRRMGWDGIGDAEAGKILDVARDNLKAVLAARAKEAGEKP